MLKLPHNQHLPQPHLMRLPHTMTLSPVESEDDELIIDIENESKAHDDNWVLDNAPDVSGIENFWEKVEDDIADDPEWFTFVDD